MAAHRRTLSTGALALLALAPVAGAGAPGSLTGAAPAAAPWWPPTLADSVGAAPRSSWAMSELGPMFMPPALSAMVYGPAGAMTPGPKLQAILAKVWEHLASRVEDLEGMERRAGLLEEEVAQLERRPLGSDAVLQRLADSLQVLRSHSGARAEELGEKFKQVRGFRSNLQQRFPASRKPLTEFFDALETAAGKVDDRYREVGRTLTRIQERMEAMRRPANPDKPRWRPSDAPAIPEAAERQPTAQEIRERMASLRANVAAEQAAASRDVVVAAEAPPSPGSAAWDPAWEEKVGGGLGEPEPVPTARPTRDPIERWESGLAAPGADAGADSMYAGRAAAATSADSVGNYSSARDLIRARYELLKQKAAGGASTDDLEREIRSHRPGDEPMPPAPPPERLAPPQPADGEELLDDFLESDTVMDPYLSKAPGALRAPDAPPVVEGDDRLAAGMQQLLARGAGGARVRPAPKVEGLGNFATRLEHELELAARTEGLDDRASFARPQRPKVPMPTGTRSVTSIMAELEALDEE